LYVAAAGGKNSGTLQTAQDSSNRFPGTSDARGKFVVRGEVRFQPFKSALEEKLRHSGGDTVQREITGGLLGVTQQAAEFESHIALRNPGIVVAGSGTSLA
jgi:hypothetical protein